MASTTQRRNLLIFSSFAHLYDYFFFLFAGEKKAKFSSLYESYTQKKEQKKNILTEFTNGSFTSDALRIHLQTEKATLSIESLRRKEI